MDKGKFPLTEPPPTVRDIPVSIPHEVCKAAVGERIVKHLLRPHGTVFFDNGTSVFKVAEKLLEHGIVDLTILTINPLIVQHFFQRPVAVNLMVGGGILRQNIPSLCGPITEGFIQSQNKVDRLIFGVEAISGDGNLWTSQQPEENQKRLMLAKFSQVLIPIDHSKVSDEKLYAIGNLGQLKDKSPVILIGTPASAQAKVDEFKRELAQKFPFCTVIVVPVTRCDCESETNGAP